MSAAQAKVALDKLLRVFEPLKESQRLLADLEIAEQRLKQINEQEVNAAEEVKKKSEELRSLEASMEQLRALQKQLIDEADTRAKDIIASARGEASNVLAQMEASKAGLQTDIDSARTAFVLLDREVAAKQEELIRVTSLVDEQREKLKQALTAI